MFIICKQNIKRQWRRYCPVKIRNRTFVNCKICHKNKIWRKKETHHCGRQRGACGQKKERRILREIVTSASRRAFHVIVKISPDGRFRI